MFFQGSAGLRTLVLASLFAAGLAWSQAAPDNTKVNKRDRDRSAATAGQAKDNASDRELMQKIRKAVMDDKSLSTYAHNLKIIAQNGHVTLKGPVRTEQEKQSIAQKAAEIAGADNVTNQISVTGAKTARKTKTTSRHE